MSPTIVCVAFCSILPCNLKLATAAGMLSTPVGAPLPRVSAENWIAWQIAFRSVAEAWEILDPREQKYILNRPEDLENDLNLLRKRAADLADAPRLRETALLPERQAVSEMLAFNRAYRRHLEHRRALEPDRAHLFQTALRETDRLYQVWDSVRDARCEFYYVTVRRQALKRIRDLLGAEAYYAGQLPAAVPLHHFTELR